MNLHALFKGTRPSTWRVYHFTTSAYGPLYLIAASTVHAPLATPRGAARETSGDLDPINDNADVEVHFEDDRMVSVVSSGGAASPHRHISIRTFPVWAWDTVYCGKYLSFARQEHDEWEMAMRQAVPDEDEWPLPEPWKAQLEASWLRLFDPLMPSHPWDDEAFGQSGSREAVLGVLQLEDVRQVTEFVGCSKWTWAAG